MPRPVIHNCFLPKWLHRLANGVVGGLCALFIPLLFVRLEPPFWTLWIAGGVAIVCMLQDPSRFSLVEGCAGRDGYDELIDENGNIIHSGQTGQDAQ